MIDSELACRFVQKRLHGDRDLVLPGTSLRGPRRRVREHRHPAKTHGLGRVDERYGAGRRGPVTEACVQAVLLNDAEVDREHPPVLSKTNLDPPLESGSRLPDKVFFRSVYPHHHRAPGFLRHQCRKHLERIGPSLRAEAASAILGDVDELVGLDAEEAGEARMNEVLALAGPIQVALAVVPIGHGAPRLHAVVGVGSRHERLVEHDFRTQKTSFDVSERPLQAGLAHRKLTVRDRAKVYARPLDPLDALARYHRVPFEPSVRSLGTQALQGVDGERQSLEFQFDLVDRVLSGGLIHRGDGEDRLTDEVRI